MPKPPADEDIAALIDSLKADADEIHAELPEEIRAQFPVAVDQLFEVVGKRALEFHTQTVDHLCERLRNQMLQMALPNSGMVLHKEGLELAIDLIIAHYRM